MGTGEWAGAETPSRLLPAAPALTGGPAGLHWLSQEQRPHLLVSVFVRMAFNLTLGGDLVLGPVLCDRLFDFSKGCPAHLGV